MEFLGREPTLCEMLDTHSRIDATAIAVSSVAEPEAGITAWGRCCPESGEGEESLKSHHVLVCCFHSNKIVDFVEGILLTMGAAFVMLFLS
jgi:hypothetical protein